MLKQTKLIGLVILGLIMLQQTWELSVKQWALIQDINLIFHEAGHTLFMWAPQFVTIVMGSGFEILVPLALTLYFLRQEQVEGVVFGLWWTGTAFWSTGIYAGDALDRSLPLIGGMDQAFHDWYNILLDLKLLYQAEPIGQAIYFIGTLCIMLSFGLLGLHLYNLYKGDEVRNTQSRNEG